MATHAARLPLRRLDALARPAQLLLALQAVLAASAAAIALNYGAGYDDEDGSGVYAAVALLQALVYVGTAIVVLCWIYRANDNVHRLGAEQLGPSPGWAVGWYFIPLGNLVMPFQAMRETWKASIDPRDWEVVRVSPILGFWWFFWLASNIAGAVALRLEFEEEFEGAGRIAEQFGTASDVLIAPASLLLMAIIGRVTSEQERRRLGAIE